MLKVRCSYNAPLGNHSTFNISIRISRNTKCDNMVSFPNSGSIGQYISNIVKPRYFFLYQI